jgi:DnaJ-class molecular chaperone
MSQITIRQLCPACGGLGCGMFPYSTGNPCPVCKGEKMITTFEKIEIPDDNIQKK